MARKIGISSRCRCLYCFAKTSHASAASKVTASPKAMTVTANPITPSRNALSFTILRSLVS